MPHSLVPMRDLFGLQSEVQQRLFGHWTGSAGSPVPRRFAGAHAPAQCADQVDEGAGPRQRVPIRPRSRRLQWPRVFARSTDRAAFFQARKLPERAQHCRIPAQPVGRTKGLIQKCLQTANLPWTKESLHRIVTILYSVRIFADRHRERCASRYSSAGRATHS